jgi:transposase InsO family protein
MIQGTDKEELTLHCLTMIDPVTGWFELAEIPAKSADVVIDDVLEQKWLNRYPRPTSVVMDRGREFMAEVKRTLKHDYGVQRKLITTRNPQANAMVERAHQMLHSMLATKEIGTRLRRAREMGRNPRSSRLCDGSHCSHNYTGNSDAVGVWPRCHSQCEVPSRLAIH